MVADNGAEIYSPLSRCNNNGDLYHDVYMPAAVILQTRTLTHTRARARTRTDSGGV